MCKLCEYKTSFLISQSIEVDMRVGNFFRDEGYVKNFLVANGIPAEVVDVMMDSKININEVNVIYICMSQCMFVGLYVIMYVCIYVCMYPL